MAPGIKTGGRRKGTLNKATIQRRLEAEIAQQVDAARDGKIELAVHVLDRAMKLAEGATGIHKPPSPQEILNAQAEENAQAARERRDPRTIYAGDWTLFGDWFERWVFCAKALAHYQSPSYKAIAVSVSPTEGPRQHAPVLEHEPRDTAERERRAADSYLRLVKA